MGISLIDAHLRYDRGIPPGIVDPHAADQLLPPRITRIVNVREKPAATRARMVKAMTMLAGTATITEQDLLRVGFTRDQLEAHAGDAMRQMLIENPTFPSIQWGA